MSTVKRAETYWSFVKVVLPEYVLNMYPLFLCKWQCWQGFEGLSKSSISFSNSSSSSFLQDEYKFIFHCTAAYLDSFEMYGNFQWTCHFSTTTFYRFFSFFLFFLSMLVQYVCAQHTNTACCHGQPAPQSVSTCMCMCFHTSCISSHAADRKSEVIDCSVTVGRFPPLQGCFFFHTCCQILTFFHVFSFFFFFLLSYNFDSTSFELDGRSHCFQQTTMIIAVPWTCNPFIHALLLI